MVTATTPLTFEEFQEQYGNLDNRYEFWFGEAVPRGVEAGSKAMPTVVHGLTQKILMKLLDQAGYVSASEVELRIVPEAHSLPHVIATRRPMLLDYPREGIEIEHFLIEE